MCSYGSGPGSFPGFDARARTCIAEIWDFPWALAVMVAYPTSRPTTSPLPATVATPPSLLLHLIVTPSIGSPDASIRWALRATTSPELMMALLGMTVMPTPSMEGEFGGGLKGVVQATTTASARPVTTR